MGTGEDGTQAEGGLIVIQLQNKSSAIRTRSETQPRRLPYKVLSIKRNSRLQNGEKSTVDDFVRLLRLVQGESTLMYLLEEVGRGERI